MKPRDLLLRRYWRREDDGTYGNNVALGTLTDEYVSFGLTHLHSIAVILYHSVFHQRCPPQVGYVRACLKSNVCLIH